MTISRRWFMAGLALTGAAVPAAFYGHREWTKPDPTITPGEASFDVADVAGQQLANTLRGVWQIRFEGRDAGIEGLPRDWLEVFLDVGHKGRGLIGFLDTAQRLRSSDEPRYRVLGAQFRRILAHKRRTAAAILDGLVKAGELRATPQDVEALAVNMTVIATYWLSYELARNPRNGDDAQDEKEESRALARGAFHVISLAAPYLAPRERELFDELSKRYLN
jgi:hypothetical protein